jgi:regulation of enolase protein 1 (concanavalin A-like superfamily)
MNSFLLAILLPAYLWIVATPAVSQSSPQVVKGWGEVTDPDGDCKVTSNGGKVTIEMPGGYHDLWPEKDKMGKVNAPRILQDVEGDFVVTVKITGAIKPQKGTMVPKLASGGPFQSGCLIIWQDKDSFLRFDRSGVYSSTKDKNMAFFYLQAFKDAKRVTDKESNKAINIFKEGQLDEDGYLRLERKDGKVYPSYSQDGGKTWLALPLPSVTIDLPQKVKIGVGAVNNTTKAFSVQFQDFEVKKVAKGGG